jgi:hypothetical protein
MNRRGFDFRDFEITKREIIASISIVAILVVIGILISGKITEFQMDRNEIYNKAIKIETADLFQYGMETNVGNAFVYGDLGAVDTVTYPEIGGEYICVKKVKERYEKHTRTVEDDDGNKKTETYYQWDVDETESKHCEEVIFLGITFSYGKISVPSSRYIDTIKDDKEWSWKSGERVKVRYQYYGVDTKYTGTIFTDLRNDTISDGTPFYDGKSIDEAVEHLQSGGGVVLFWIFWIILIVGCVFGFYYLDNRWLE